MKEETCPWTFEKSLMKDGEYEIPEYFILDRKNHMVALAWDSDAARLMAAAPEMLAACEMILGSWGGSSSVDAARDAARAAIAKATAEPR